MSVLLRVEPSAFVGDLASTGDLGSLVVALLSEGREQDDPVVGRESVSDPSCCRPQREAKLEQAIAERSKERHSCRGTEAGESIDGDDGAVPVGVVEARHPVDDLVVEFDAGLETQYRKNAIIAQLRCSAPSATSGTFADAAVNGRHCRPSLPTCLAVPTLALAHVHRGWRRFRTVAFCQGPAGSARWRTVG